MSRTPLCLLPLAMVFDPVGVICAVLALLRHRRGCLDQAGMFDPVGVFGFSSIRIS